MRPHDAELLDRLRKLEYAVDTLSGHVATDDAEVSSREVDGNPESGMSPPPDETRDQKILRIKQELKALKREKKEVLDATLPTDESSLANRFGRLIVSEGRSRYISPMAWASLNAEVSSGSFSHFSCYTGTNSSLD